MTEIELYCCGASASAVVRGDLTAGAVGIPVRLRFDSDWTGLTVRLAARCGAVSRWAVIDEQGQAVLPWECLVEDEVLHLGVDGWSKDGSLRIPTVWAGCGRVRPSAALAGEVAGSVPTPGILEQIQRLAQDAVNRAETAVQMVENLEIPDAGGIPGGYYVPQVTQSGQLHWEPSQEGMPSVADARIVGPKGDPGPPGEAGTPGAPGEAGRSPMIGSSGCWMVPAENGGWTDTGVYAGTEIPVPVNKGGTGAVEKELAAKNLGWKNPNLLDNPWFTVNQRNFSSNAGDSANKVYTVDRWYHSGQNANAQCSFSGGNVGLTNTAAAENKFCQVIAPEKVPAAGTRVTVSIRCKSNTGFVVARGSASAWNSVLTVPVYNSSFRTYSASFSWISGHDRILIVATASGAAISIQAVKLELGEVSTLENDSAPDYAGELMKCQRYFQSAGPVVMPTLATQAGKAFQFHPRLIVSMASTPALSVQGISWIRGQGDEDFVPTGSYTIGLYNQGITTPGYNLVFSTVQTKRNLALYVMYIRYTLSADL